MIEAKKLAYADMLRYVGDPHFSKIPVAAMLSKDTAATRVQLKSIGRSGTHSRFMPASL
jgi:gamma-glutamyltranspeptidase / glutathione hydrolase